MKFCAALAVILLLGVSNAERFENPFSGNNKRWNPEKITKVQLVMNPKPMAGGVDITVKVCYRGNCCNVNMGALTARQIKTSERGECRNIEINQDSKDYITAQVLSGNPNNLFKVLFVDIITEHGAHFQARFPNKRFSRQSTAVTPIIFFPSNQISLDVPEPDCTAADLQDENNQVGNLQSCPGNRMLATSVLGTHNYACDFGCRRIRNTNPEEHGNGFRCFESAMPQSEVQYCCRDGPAGDIPGCNIQEENDANEFAPVSTEGVTYNSGDSSASRNVPRGEPHRNMRK